MTSAAYAADFFVQRIVGYQNNTTLSQQEELLVKNGLLI